MGGVMDGRSEEERRGGGMLKGEREREVRKEIKG